MYSMIRYISSLEYDYLNRSKITEEVILVFLNVLYYIRYDQPCPISNRAWTISFLIIYYHTKSFVFAHSCVE